MKKNLYGDYDFESATSQKVIYVFSTVLNKREYLKVDLHVNNRLRDSTIFYDCPTVANELEINNYP